MIRKDGTHAAGQATRDARCTGPAAFTWSATDDTLLASWISAESKQWNKFPGSSVSLGRYRERDGAAAEELGQLVRRLVDDLAQARVGPRV